MSDDAALLHTHCAKLPPSHDSLYTHKYIHLRKIFLIPSLQNRVDYFSNFYLMSDSHRTIYLCECEVIRYPPTFELPQLFLFFLSSSIPTLHNHVYQVVLLASINTALVYDRGGTLWNTADHNKCMSHTICMIVLFVYPIYNNNTGVYKLFVYELLRKLLLIC